MTLSPTIFREEQYVYLGRGQQSSELIWSVSSGEILNGQGTEMVPVNWSKLGEGILSVIEYGTCQSIQNELTVNVKVITSNESVNNKQTRLHPNPIAIEDNLTVKNINYNSVIKLYSIDGKMIDLSH